MRRTCRRASDAIQMDAPGSQKDLVVGQILSIHVDTVKFLKEDKMFLVANITLYLDYGSNVVVITTSHEQRRRCLKVI